MSRALAPSSKQSGEDVEHQVVERVDGLDPVGERDAGHDAVAARPLGPAEIPLASTPLVLAGRPVEIKAAQTRLASGERGRFYIRRGQHEALVAGGGYYLAAVYAPTRPDHEVRGLVACPATIVDELLPAWRTHGGDRPGEAYTQLAWSNVVDPADVAEGRR